jgi:hypothetical protein
MFPTFIPVKPLTGTGMQYVKYARMAGLEERPHWGQAVKFVGNPMDWEEYTAHWVKPIKTYADEAPKQTKEIKSKYLSAIGYKHK